ncbi:MAG: ABC transporter ATP-binding protein [Actinoallomurus sp.]
MTALKIHQVTKSFGDVQALGGVDLQVADKTLTAILGPSGCGKTTLLRLVAGFTTPDSGTIAFGDQQVAGPGHSLPPQRRGVGYVPQEGALFPHLDIAANITFGLPRRGRRSRRPVPELLELVGLSEQVAGRYPHELSGGQQQRVALARALAPRPSIILLDEPFSSLDAALRLNTGRAVAGALRAAGATAVLVTHDQNEALSLADQVAVMTDGRILQTGTPDSIYSRPVDLEVAGFVGAAVIIPATLDGETAHTALGPLTLAGPSQHGPAQVLIRPEQITINSESTTDGIPARVSEVAYYGHDATVQVRPQPEGPTVTARIMGGRPPVPGTPVRVSVHGTVSAYPIGERAAESPHRAH